MPNVATPHESRRESHPLAAKPLDEARWQAWLAKGRAHDRRVNGRALTAVALVATAALIGVAALWSRLGEYEVILRSLIVLGAVVITFHAIHEKQYEMAALFAGCAAVYNPLVPAFTFSGDWQRAVVAATVVPFAAILFPTKVSRI